MAAQPKSTHMNKPSSRYPREWQWPGGENIAISVTLAFESFVNHSQITLEKTANKTDHFSLSYAQYGAKAGIWRLMDLLDEFGIKSNVSTNGLAAERHPDVIRALTDAGHEVAGHAWANDILMRDDDPAAELEEIRRCTRVLTETAGRPPSGWTSPGSAGSANTLDFLVQEGYLWNADDASDDLPFLRQTAHGPIVIMPRTNLPHNDLWMWVLGRNPPGIIWDGFKDTFDELYREGRAGKPKWTEITLHAHMAGRPTLIPTLRRCLQYAMGHEGVWWATKTQIAAWAKQREGTSA
ncbi:polysaccharide deacetylase family protein [Bordetella bronchialis]